MAHGHHAIDAEKLHVLRQELLLMTLPLGCLDHPPGHSFPLQILDLGWEGTPGMAGAQETWPQECSQGNKGLPKTSD